MADPSQVGIPGVSLEPGDHVCALYFGDHARDELLVPFIRAGLIAGNKCLCIVDQTDPDTVLSAMDADFDVHGYVSSHQLELMTPDESYLRTGGFVSSDMIDFWRAFLDESHTAPDRDFTRIIAEMTWALRSGGVIEDDLLAYESEFNRLAIHYQQFTLCLYDLERFGGGILMELMKTHPKLLLGGMLLENPHYVPPDEYLASR